jgi:tetratricopeptide (TPR) repeat protein
MLGPVVRNLVIPRTVALAVLSCSAACEAARPATSSPQQILATLPSVPPPPRPAPSLPPGPPAPPPADHPIVFVENDYARALADARARRVPLFVDVWASWCHTCLSMRSYVFPDRSLWRYADRFVWLSLDSERDASAALVSKLGVRFLPTLLVLDPATERPVVAWPGSLTASELATLLDDAEVSVRRGDAGGQATAMLLRGHEASSNGKLDEAIASYRSALAAAPADWPRRPQAIDALVTRLGDAEKFAECLSTASEGAPTLPPGTALADVLREGFVCSESVPRGEVDRAKVARLVTLGEGVVADATQPILADDRSDLYQYLVNALRDLGRPEEARKLAAPWATFLEDRASHATTPAERAVFDAHRLLAYVALGEAERAVSMLEQSERDFPSDYNPPARLATAFLELKRYDEATSAVKRALERAYGPRKLRLWSLEADIALAKGDKTGARQALEEALAFAKNIPLTREYPKLRDRLQKRLDDLR